MGIGNGTGIMAGGAGITPPTDQYGTVAAQVNMYQKTMQTPSAKPKVTINLEDAFL